VPLQGKGSGRSTDGNQRNREHTTATAGATELIFALFDLLGFRFAPRLRDLHDRRLFAAGPIDMQRYPRLQPHIPDSANRPRILAWWDEMVRAAGSIKLGWVTASLLVQKLQAYLQQNALARALQAYGRLARTRHILRRYAYPALIWRSCHTVPVDVTHLL
jgi:TnpA family transposase